MNAPINPPAPLFYDYRFSAEPIAMMGRMRAFGTRLLVRAILKNDGYKGPLTIVTYNAIDAEAFEILSVGGGVATKCKEMGEEVPRPGQHCDVRSVAADRVHASNTQGRYWLVDVADVAAVWDPVEGDSEELVTACEMYLAQKADAPIRAVAPTGEIEIAPG